MNSLSFRKCATSAIVLMTLVLNAEASFPSRVPFRHSDVIPGPSAPPQPAPNQTAKGVAQNPDVSADCTPYPLDQFTWNRFHWDDYLRTYPNVTTQAYAATKGAANFRCGIGANCNIGQVRVSLMDEQLCSPVKAPDWYILYAAQNLNIYLNALHQAAAEAISLTQSHMRFFLPNNQMLSLPSGMTCEHMPDYPSVEDHSDLEAVFAFGAVAATVQAVGVLYLLLIPNPALLFTAAPFAVMSVINMPFTLMMFASLAAIVAGQAILACHDTSGPSQTKEFDFIAKLTIFNAHTSDRPSLCKWAQFNYRLSQWQGETERSIANTTSRIFNSGINSDPAYSLSHILANGTFLGPFERKDSFELQASLKNVTKSIAISKLLRSMTSSLIRRTRLLRSQMSVFLPHDPHPNKQWTSKDVLSYHSPNGTLMNIIRAVPGKTKAINDFKNGHVLHEKHGISTEQIAEISFQCQQKFGIQKTPVGSVYDLSRHAAIRDPEICSFDLPVCDMRSLGEFLHYIHSRGNPEHPLMSMRASLFLNRIPTPEEQAQAHSEDLQANVWVTNLKEIIPSLPS
ncbi:hypothetical protein VP01_1434g2 [Puccinia sorghi]|uniref:DUF7872 domain-containing protein n=1 Tax=Puccinia sorghi TaxID=27349 RepID=A0A0L6VKW4_9BASI|nr:hypothetical protein VP01_1434g2 [Puccinia sorghi]